MEYMSCPEAAEKWGISERRVQILCKQNRIPGVSKIGYMLSLIHIQEKEAQPEQAAPAPYYTINEVAAKRAKDMNSFSDYKQGSATAEYRHYVDEAVQLAERQKQRVDPMYHEKIDSLLDTYARKLAANMNKGYEIDARVPSILIAGGSNFPTRKKEKQNAARDSNYREWQDIQGILDKIRSTGMRCV